MDSESKQPENEKKQTKISSIPFPQINSQNMQKRIGLMFNWFTDVMTDSTTNRFFYEYNPSTNKLSHKSSPIRDLGTAWDTANILTFFTSQNIQNISESKITSLSSTIKNTTKYYYNFMTYYRSHFNIARNIKQKDCAYIKSSNINEISTIAHSAFLILSMLSAYNNNIITQNKLENTVPYLVNGILNNQDIDIKSKTYGAFKIDFEKNQYGYYHGIRLYPAEAMLSLLMYYKYLCKTNKKRSAMMIYKTKQLQIINSIKNAFTFYSKYFYDGHVTSDYIIFFSNWQSQLFSLLFDILNKNKNKMNQNDFSQLKCIGKYVLNLQRSVLQSDSFKSYLNPNGKKYDNVSTVEIACGLESLADGLKVAYILKDFEMSKSICNGCENGVVFLNKIQTISKNGGFAHGTYRKRQRIDVTGHVANAYIKVIELLKKA